MTATDSLQYINARLDYLEQTVSVLWNRPPQVDESLQPSLLTISPTTGLATGLLFAGNSSAPILISGLVVNTATFLQSINGANPLGGNQFQFSTSVIQAVGISSAGVYADSSPTDNLYQIMGYINNAGTAPAVALWGMGVGGHVWGSNLGCYSYTPGASTAAGIGIEIDFANMSNAASSINGTQAVVPNMTIVLHSTAGAYVPTATAPGLMNYGAALFNYTGVSGATLTGCNLIAGSVATLTDGHAVTYCTGGATTAIDLVVGTLQGAPSQSFIQLSATNAWSSCANGILFQGGSHQPVNNQGILFNNTNMTNGVAFNTGLYGGDVMIFSFVTAQNAINISGGTFNAAAITVSPSSSVAGIDLSGGTFGAGVAIKLGNNNIITGTTLIGGAAGSNLQVQSSGANLGFYGTTPTAQFAAIPPPAGGATIDSQARTAIDGILSLLGAATGGVGLTA